MLTKGINDFLNKALIYRFTISLPFKILLFVLIDGWVKLSHGLITGYL